MPATPGEQVLLGQLTRLTSGQAPGSFGPGQALALLAGFVKLRDRVDTLDETTAALLALDAETRLSALEAEVGDALSRLALLEQADVDATARMDGLEARVAALEQAAPGTVPPPTG